MGNPCKQPAMLPNENETVTIKYEHRYISFLFCFLIWRGLEIEASYCKDIFEGL
jgi:hypothetical protein